MIYCSRMDVLTMDAVLQQMKGSEFVPLHQHVCRHTWVCVREAKPHDEVTCSGACSVCEAAEEEAESLRGAGKGKQELTGSTAASAAGPGQGDSLLLVSPHHMGVWIMRGLAVLLLLAGHISAATLGEHPIPVPLGGQRVHSEIWFCKEWASFCSWGLWVMEVVGL